MKSLFVLFVLAGLAVPFVAEAQEDPAVYPVLSLNRLQFGTRLTYDWYGGTDFVALPAFPVDKEWSVGIGGAYALVNNVNAIGRIQYGLDSKLVSGSLGVHLTLFSGR